MRRTGWGARLVAGKVGRHQPSRYARFERPGHVVTGDRSQRQRKWMDPATRVGYDFCHAIVDDHSRLAYVELHPDERAATVTGFVERALEFFEAGRRSAAFTTSVGRTSSRCSAMLRRCRRSNA